MGGGSLAGNGGRTTGGGQNCFFPCDHLASLQAVELEGTRLDPAATFRDFSYQRHHFWNGTTSKRFLRRFHIAPVGGYFTGSENPRLISPTVLLVAIGAPKSSPIGNQRPSRDGGMFSY